jgi:hypothetical protein
MTTYSYSQLEELWVKNGGPPSVESIAAAIALAESGGRNDNNNYNDSNGQGGTQTSWGLWQISNGTHSMPVPNINDPNVNAQQAVAKYRASGWQPWGTYTSGAYRQFLQGNVPPATGAIPGSGSSGATGAVTTGSPVGGIVGGALSAALPGGLGTIFSGILGAGGAPQTDIGSIASDLFTFLKMAAWLYNPANWVRIGSFVLGVFLLAGAGWMFKEAV